MQLFKDTVALEACPAKTAESVSYGATFLVLAWLLLNNYSSFRSARSVEESVNSSLDSAFEPFISLRSDDDTENLPSLHKLTFKVAESKTPVIGPVHSGLITQTEALPSSFADIESNLALYSPDDTESIVLPSADFHRPGQNRQQRRLQTLLTPIDGDPEKVLLATRVTEGLPLNFDLNIQDIVAETAFLSADLNAYNERELDVEYLILSTELASTDVSSPIPIQEITVNGSEADRLLSRPDKIQRPQLPRPYRAQAIQRILILPPRVQALGP